MDDKLLELYVADSVAWAAYDGLSARNPNSVASHVALHDALESGRQLATAIYDIEQRH